MCRRRLEIAATINRRMAREAIAVAIAIRSIHAIEAQCPVQMTPQLIHSVIRAILITRTSLQFGDLTARLHRVLC